MLAMFRKEDWPCLKVFRCADRRLPGAAVLFILSLGGLNQETARRGNVTASWA